MKLRRLIRHFFGVRAIEPRYGARAVETCLGEVLAWVIIAAIVGGVVALGRWLAS